MFYCKHSGVSLPEGERAFVPDLLIKQWFYWISKKTVLFTVLRNPRKVVGKFGCFIYNLLIKQCLYMPEGLLSHGHVLNVLN